jgi:hypothetical protein
MWYQGNNGNPFTTRSSRCEALTDGSLFMAGQISKTIDDAAGTSRYYVNASGDPHNFRNNRGLSTFDRPHRLSLSFNLPIPNPSNNPAFSRQVFSDWQVSGVGLIQSEFHIRLPTPERAGLDGISGGVGFVDTSTARRTQPVPSRAPQLISEDRIRGRACTRFGTLAATDCGSGQANSTLQFSGLSCGKRRPTSGLSSSTSSISRISRTPTPASDSSNIRD